MAEAPACERRLDVPLRLVDGGATNLGHFCGQKLIVTFCPAEPTAAAGEIRAYEALAPQFEQSGAWLVAVLEWPGGGPAERDAGASMNLGLDPDGSAFLALARTAPEVDFDARAGATFLIDRDGSVRYAWPGVGHARQALERARERP
jgi:peroxiredoxin